MSHIFKNLSLYNIGTGFQVKTVRLQKEKIEKSVSNFSNIKKIFILTLDIKELILED